MWACDATSALWRLVKGIHNIFFWLCDDIKSCWSYYEEKKNTFLSVNPYLPGFFLKSFQTCLCIAFMLNNNLGGFSNLQIQQKAHCLKKLFQSKRPYDVLHRRLPAGLFPRIKKKAPAFVRVFNPAPIVSLHIWTTGYGPNNSEFSRLLSLICGKTDVF